MTRWHVVRGHNGNLVAVQRPPEDVVFLEAFETRADALDFIAERNRERRIAGAILVAVLVVVGVWSLVRMA